MASRNDSMCARRAKVKPVFDLQDEFTNNFISIDDSSDVNSCELSGMLTGQRNSVCETRRKLRRDDAGAKQRNKQVQVDKVLESRVTSNNDGSNATNNKQLSELLVGQCNQDCNNENINNCNVQVLHLGNEHYKSGGSKMQEIPLSNVGSVLNLVQVNAAIPIIDLVECVDDISNVDHATDNCNSQCISQSVNNIVCDALEDLLENNDGDQEPDIQNNKVPVIELDDEIDNLLEEQTSSKPPYNDNEVNHLPEEQISDRQQEPCSGVDPEGELEILLEEQIMLNIIKKMKSNLSIDRLNDQRLVTETEDGGTISSSETDDSESLFNFGDDKKKEKTSKLNETYIKVSRALTLNAIMNADLITLYEHLNNRLKDNRKKQKALKIEIATLEKKDKQKCLLPMKTYSSFGIPYFKDIKLFRCPFNSDYKKMQLNNQILSINMSHSKKWRLKDKIFLEHGIKSILIEEETAELRLKEETLKYELENVGDELKKETFHILLRIREQIDAAKKQSVQDLCASSSPYREFDWLRLSAEYVINHSDVECQRMWHLYVKPIINKKKWTVEEDNRVIQLAQEFKYQEWDQLAKRLGTRRSGYQCFINYQTRLNKDIKKSGKWTQEEDNMLINMVSKCRFGDYIPWVKISYFFKGRTLSQIYSRFNGCLNPNLKKGRFSKHEDKLIVLLVRKFGEDFTKIAKMFGDRTSTQLRERYSRAVRGKYQNTGRWSLEEDKLLISLSQRYGERNWSAISKHFVTRTRTQIRQRHFAITNALAKQPEIPVEKFHRGPKAKSQIIVNAPIQDDDINGDDEDELDKKQQLVKFINENNEIDALFQGIKTLRVGLRGRKKITHIARKDNEIIKYFREAYTGVNFKCHTQFGKPDNLDRAAVAMLLLFRCMQTHIHQVNLGNSKLKKLPVTLRNVIDKMKDKSCNWGCNCLSSDASCSWTCLQVNSIDCFPTTRKSTMVAYDAFRLNSVPQYRDLYKDIKSECRCATGSSKQVFPYYLAPNLITMVALRSALLMMNKITHSLLYDKIRTGYFQNVDVDIKNLGLKICPKFFPDDERNSSDDEMNTSTNISKCNQYNNKLVDCQSQASCDLSKIPLQKSLSCLSSTRDKKRNANSSTSTATPGNDSREIDLSMRLTKQDAINLWKERLLVIFGLPIVLSNCPRGDLSCIQLGNEETTKNNYGCDQFKYCSKTNKKRKTETITNMYRNRYFQDNEVLKTEPIVVKEKRKAFQIFEEALSDDDFVDENIEEPRLQQTYDTCIKVPPTMVNSDKSNTVKGYSKLSRRKRRRNRL